MSQVDKNTAALNDTLGRLLAQKAALDEQSQRLDDQIMQSRAALAGYKQAVADFLQDTETADGDDANTD